jgi:hypothetical protein
MTETIIKIEETTFSDEKEPWKTYGGYVITTTNQIIKFGISQGQSCCEEFGYFASEDNLDEFIGAELLDIESTDTALNTKKIEDELDISLANTMFITFKTNKGVFQLTAYNQHNGYYGHDVVVISQQLTLEDNI